ncbi:MAG: hypothetical protein ACOYMZ_03130 [Minisyncoccia bacterium]
MGIEQRIEFDVFGAEKMDVAKKFNILPTEDNLAKLEKRDEVWYFGALPVEDWDRITSEEEKVW